MSFTRAPELLDDFTVKCKDILESDFNIDSDTAREMTLRLARYLKDDWGGQQIYIPKCPEDVLTERDRELWSKFNGTNHADLAREYGVSSAWVYKIIKYMRAAEISERQLDAFPDENLQGNPARRRA